MEMLSNEIQLWVKRCEEMVEVLREVEMERDNYKAGEGVAKALGKGVKVKLEEMDVGGGTTATLDLAAELADNKTELADTKNELLDIKIELADTKTKLADTETELADTEAELANTKSQLFNTNQDLNRSKAALSQSAIQLAAAAAGLKRKNEESLVLDKELQRQIGLAKSRAVIITRRDAALVTMEEERDLARENWSLEREGSSEQLDEMEGGEPKAAGLYRVPLEEFEKKIETQLDEIKHSKLNGSEKSSGVEMELNDLRCRITRLRSFVLHLPEETFHASEAESGSPANPARDSTCTQGQGERSAIRLKLDALWTSLPWPYGDQRDETSDTDDETPNADSWEIFVPQCWDMSELLAELSVATSAVEISRANIQASVKRWLISRSSPTTPAELETAEVACEISAFEVQMSRYHCLRMIRLMEHCIIANQPGPFILPLGWGWDLGPGDGP